MLVVFTLLLCSCIRWWFDPAGLLDANWGQHMMRLLHCLCFHTSHQHCRDTNSPLPPSLGVPGWQGPSRIMVTWQVLCPACAETSSIAQCDGGR